MNVRIVNMNWLDRICAMLLGKRRVVDANGMRLYVSWWRGVLYVLHMRRLTSVPADRTGGPVVDDESAAARPTAEHHR